MTKKQNLPIKGQIKTGLMEFWDEVLEPVLGEIDKDVKDLKQDNQELKAGVHRLQSGQSDLSRQLNDVKGDTPTQKEFADLKHRVNNLEHFRTAN